MVETSRYERDYVVWDGIRERPYRGDALGHDCVVTADLKLISVQSLRRHLIDAGHNVVVVFACERLQGASEIRVNKKWNGLFTLCWLESVQDHAAVTLREAVVRTNAEMRRRGFGQKCEALCEPWMLDQRLFGEGDPNRVNVMMVFDMCRTLRSKSARLSRSVNEYGARLT